MVYKSKFDSITKSHLEVGYWRKLKVFKAAGLQQTVGVEFTFLWDFDMYMIIFAVLYESSILWSPYIKFEILGVNLNISSCFRTYYYFFQFQIR